MVFNKLLTKIKVFVRPLAIEAYEAILLFSCNFSHLHGCGGVSRSDRRIGSVGRAGIGLIVRDQFSHNIMHIGESLVDVRGCRILHRDCVLCFFCV